MPPSPLSLSPSLSPPCPPPALPFRHCGPPAPSKGRPSKGGAVGGGARHSPQETSAGGGDARTQREAEGLRSGLRVPPQSPRPSLSLSLAVASSLSRSSVHCVCFARAALVRPHCVPSPQLGRDARLPGLGCWRPRAPFAPCSPASGPFCGGLWTWGASVHSAPRGRCGG